ncbi:MULTISPECIES: phage/plasmid replication domain-containing protein [Leptospira]|uniref:Replication-associated protein G2P N-terminal domain-containing protein n=1 Tax=Leptospira weilii str. UI 13098 TaxID=1088542 RepID=M6QDR2_9LEPT|nr:MULTISPECIES: phage/plasmid replication protein [Leptospira]EMN91350.1 hypothetical protein LEP1GSC108_3243 [Leptospira weilii str. UI 13098]
MTLVENNENQLSNSRSVFSDIQKIEQYYGFDKIHIYTPIQNTIIPQKLFREISRRKKAIDGFGYRIKRYNDNQLYLNISFSPATVYHGINLYAEVPINSLELIIPAELRARDIEVKNWEKIYISRLDFYTNVVTDNDYSTYEFIHKALSFNNTHQWIEESTVYLYNESFRIAIYDKTAEIKKKNPNVDIDLNVTRIEFRLLNKKKIISTLGPIINPKTNETLKVFPLYALSDSKIDEFMNRFLMKLTYNIENFQFRPTSDNLENELIAYFTSSKSKKSGIVPRRKAKEALKLFEIYNSASYVDFLRNQPEYSRIKKVTKKRIKEYVFLKRKFAPLLSAALLIDHLISFGDKYIMEFIDKSKTKKNISRY